MGTLRLVSLPTSGRGLESLGYDQRSRLSGWTGSALPILRVECQHYLVSERLIPAKNPEDALHIGIAAAEGIHYLLTWNFKHINNAETKIGISELIESLGFAPPTLCSPEELGGTND